MKKMITKQGQVYLYLKQKDNALIQIMLLKSGKIKTLWCKANNECAKRKYYENKRILHQLKINGCAKCGYNECDACLEFHHVNPEDKKYSISASRVAKKNFVDELNKCILLCCRCHREIEKCRKVT